MSTKPSLFVDGDQTTLIMAAYLNDLRTLCYELAGDGTNAPSTAAQVRSNLGAAETGVNTDITSLASGLVLAGAPALDDTSLKVVTAGWVQAKFLQTLEGGSVSNLQLFAETVGNSLQISLVDPTGAALSATNPGWIGFISDYGTYDQSFETVTSALTLTVPAGATLGMVSGRPARLWVLAIRPSGGGVALAVQNCVYDNSTGNAGGYILSVGQGAYPTATASNEEMTSTVAISTSADENAPYSESAHTARPFTVIGCIDITCAVAGTWTGATLHGCRTNPPFRPGEQRAVFYRISGAEDHSASEVIPDDDSIPQTSEGHTASGLTAYAYPYPGCAPDWIEVTVHLGLSTAAAALVIASLYRTGDSGDVRAAARASQPAASGTVWVELTLFEPRTTNSVIDYQTRFGASTAVVVTLNGAASARKLGGSMNSRVRVRSISA